MKRGNASMNKPTLNRIDGKLDAFIPNTKSKRVYQFECPRCGSTHTFTESDLKDRVVQCKNCKYEEIFFRSNYGG